MAAIHLLRAAARQLLNAKRLPPWKPLAPASSNATTTFKTLFDYGPHATARARFSQLVFGRSYSSVAAAVPEADDQSGSESASVRGPEGIRCFAIIAHVDHGKTTLLDQLLKQVGDSLTTERVMDSMSLEKERGITIAAKYTSLPYKGYTLNAVDTPGHADFGGEVERVLDMVDGAVLLVDATEGPLAQTKFVLSKALRRGLRPLVLFNKVDRPTVTAQRCSEVESELFDLFALLGATDEQLDFPVLYASAKEGWVTARLPSAADPLRPEERVMDPLLDSILQNVPPPAGDPGGPFKMLVSMTERDPFLGRILTGRIASGRVRVNDRVHALALKGDGSPHDDGRVTKILKRLGGLGRVTMTEAGAGDIVSIAGLERAGVTDTVAAVEVNEALPATPIDVPTIKMVMGVNDSPLGGRDGTHVTGSKIGERLMSEAENNVSIVVSAIEGGAESYEVQGRGELQLGVLIETMRREGFEMSISPPAVLLQTGERGEKLEPIEEVVVEVDVPYMGMVIEALTLRKGELEEMLPDGAGPGRARLVFTCPSRGLLGYRSVFTTDTHGTGVMHRAFREYGPWRGGLDRVRKGALVSMAQGPSTAHALGSLESRGVLFIAPQEDCYDGMIIGEHSRGEDLEVNPVRAKQLSNMRASGTDEKVRLQPPRAMTLEEAIGYVAADELIEVTPKSVRLRKKYLNSSQRKNSKRRESS